MAFYSDFARYYDRVFPFNRDVARFLETYLPDPPARVLDVGCGTGAYAAYLAERGFEVEAVDLNATMIEQARGKYPEVKFRVLDMREVDTLRGHFQAIYCIGNTAAHLPHDEFVTFLHHIHALLDPNGMWLLQVMNWDYVLARTSFILPELHGDDGLVFHRLYHGVSPARVTFATRLERDGKIVFEAETPLYPWRWASLCEIHGELGFELVAHLGSFRGEAFDAAAFSANISVWRRVL